MLQYAQDVFLTVKSRKLLFETNPAALVPLMSLSAPTPHPSNPETEAAFLWISMWNDSVLWKSPIRVRPNTSMNLKIKLIEVL